MKRKEYAPLGRLNELRSRPDAELLATKAGHSWDSEYTIIYFATRNALINFIRASKDNTLHALVKDAVLPNMMVDGRYQRAV